MPDNKPIEQVLLDANVDWRAWPIVGPPKISSQFNEGLNHQTLLLESSGKKYVLKIFESAAPMAIAAQRWAAKHSLAPQIVYAPNDGRYLLMELISGEILHLPLNDHSLNSLSNIIATLHHKQIDQTGIACGYFNYLAYCDYYLRACESKIQELHKSLLPALKIFTSDKTPHCFCHNDLVTSNWLEQNNNAVLLDWEFAQINNPWFDLASIMVYCNLDSEQSQKFLADYDSSMLVQYQQPIYYAAQCAVLWLDILWHLEKFGAEYFPNLVDKLDQIKKLTGFLDLRVDF